MNFRARRAPVLVTLGFRLLGVWGFGGLLVVCAFSGVWLFFPRAYGCSECSGLIRVLGVWGVQEDRTGTAQQDACRAEADGSPSFDNT